MNDESQAKADPTSGHTYYVNRKTGESSWEKPDRASFVDAANTRANEIVGDDSFLATAMQAPSPQRAGTPSRAQTPPRSVVRDPPPLDYLLAASSHAEPDSAMPDIAGAAFMKADADRSGGLSLGEIRALLEAEGFQNIDGGYLQQLVQAFDVDKTGQIDLKQFVSLYGAIQAHSTHNTPSANQLLQFQKFD